MSASYDRCVVAPPLAPGTDTARGSLADDRAAAARYRPLRVGAWTADPPVVLAPMAGITNPVFRSLCASFGPAIFVGEMVSARALRYGDARSWDFVRFGAHEAPRSLQLYATDPADVRAVVGRLVAEDRVDHVDLNFGCPVPKVTRRGGGAAIPLKGRLLAAIVAAAVAAAGEIPVTMKFRTGIDERLSTYLDAGRIGEAEGCAAVALHGRSAVQFYDGPADWSAIAALKEEVRTIPVLGNGDIWEAPDALAMIERTGCDGVVVGRGCLGRPWLFRDLARAFGGHEPLPAPRFGEVAEVMRAHARELVGFRGDERVALREFRKHASWYAKGYPLGGTIRTELGGLDSLADLDAVLAGTDPSAAVNSAALRAPRAKGGRRTRVALPDGYLDSLDDDSPPEAHDSTGG